MILSALLGLIGSLAPHLLDFFSKAQDNKQELAILNLQMQMAAATAQQKLNEIGAQADIAETSEIYKTYNTGVRWIDAFNGTVRPVLMYSFFLLYCFVKYAQYVAYEGAHGTLPWLTVQAAIWNADDMALFTTMVAFYFGNRTLAKLRGL